MFSGLVHKYAAVPLVAICALVGACTNSTETSGLQVDNAQIRDLLPGRDTTAGYFTLSNNTSEPLTLVGAESTHAQAIEMHKSVVRGDSVGMQRVEQQTIGPGERVDFQPGGLHLMIFGVAALEQSTLITLQFANGERLAVSFSKLPN